MIENEKGAVASDAQKKGANMPNINSVDSKNNDKASEQPDNSRNEKSVTVTEMVETIVGIPLPAGFKLVRLAPQVRKAG